MIESPRPAESGHNGTVAHPERGGRRTGDDHSRRQVRVRAVPKPERDMETASVKRGMYFSSAGGIEIKRTPASPSGDKGGEHEKRILENKHERS